MSLAGGGVDHPEMAALVVEPAGVVELVGNVRVVADVALARVGGDVVAGPGAGESDEALAVGRPLEGGDAILQMGQHLGFAAGHREHADLRARAVGFNAGSRAGGIGGGRGRGRRVGGAIG